MKPFHKWLSDMTEDLSEKVEEEVKLTKEGEGWAFSDNNFGRQWLEPEDLYTHKDIMRDGNVIVSDKCISGCDPLGVLE